MSIFSPNDQLLEDFEQEELSFECQPTFDLLALIVL